MPKDNKIISISFNRAIAIIGGTVLTTMVTTIFAGVSIARSTTFIANSNARAIDRLEENCAKKEVVTEQYVSLEKNITDLKDEIKELSKKFDSYVLK